MAGHQHRWESGVEKQQLAREDEKGMENNDAVALESEGKAVLLRNSEGRKASLAGCGVVAQR